MEGINFNLEELKRIGKATEVSKIGNITNYTLSKDANIGADFRKEFEKLLDREVGITIGETRNTIKDILEGKGYITMAQLEESLSEAYIRGTEYNTNDGRFSLSIGYSDLSVIREERNILLPNGDTSHPGVGNIGTKVIDPLGWSSRVPAPTRGYGILGKIPELRPGTPEKPSQKLDEKAYEKIMNMRVKLEFMGYALEVNEETGEKVLMPVIKIVGGREEFLKFVDGKFIIDNTKPGNEPNMYIQTAKSRVISE